MRTQFVGGILALVGMFAIVSTPHASPVLSISGPTMVQQGDLGVMFSVDVADDVGGALDISGAEVRVTFDAAVFEFVSGTPGDLVTPPDDAFSANAVGAEVAISIIMDIFDPIMTDGALATLTFNVLPDATVGATALGFNVGQTDLFDSFLDPLPFGVNGLDVDTTASAAAPAPAPAAWLLLAAGLLLMRRTSLRR